MIGWPAYVVLVLLIDFLGMSMFAGHVNPNECDVDTEGHDIDDEANEGDNEGQYETSIVHTTPGGHMYWTPILPDEVKPRVNMVFRTLEEGEKFYERYARLAGFESRKSTAKKGPLGEMRMRLIVCNKEGVPDRIKYSGLDAKKQKQRLVPSGRTGCKAQVRLRMLRGGSYEIYRYEEQHNHCLVPSKEAHLMRSSRKLTFEQQTMIHMATNVNIGAVNTHKLCRELAGGYEHVGASRTDFKNFKRDINCYIGCSDAQMVVDKYTLKSKNDPNFHFNHSTKDDGSLDMIFWADETAIANYIAFGDVVSFDATYRTNRYNMVLVPFTGINNHKKCVSFGIGLLSKEDVKSYVWVLKAFLNAHGREPIVVVTDQDPSMKQAVPSVFDKTVHRLCMWHIMDKLAVKVGPALCNVDSTFSQRLRGIVWNEEIGADEFETEWGKIMVDFNLQGHKWLSEMYNMRERWIPAFFQKMPLSGLMKTTSLSEGQNNFFNHYLNGNSTLVEFFSRFESALDSQRNMQKTLDYKSRTKQLKLRTGLKMEKQAANTFTLKVFGMIQDEICNSAFGVLPINCIENEGTKTYTVKETGGDACAVRPIVVVFETQSVTIACSCMRFEREGILCRHVFYVLRLNEVNEIPKNYISLRWTKDVFTVAIAKLQHTGEQKGSTTSKTEDNIQRMYTDVAYCIQLLRGDDEGMENAMNRIHELREEITARYGKTTLSKSEVLEQLVGVAQPSEITVHPPQGIRNKGCGSGKRMISDRDNAIAKNAKTRRRCKNCHVLAHHDSRNCPHKDGQ